MRNFLTLLLLCVLPISAAAENSTQSGEFTIHHNAFKSDFLDPHTSGFHFFKIRFAKMKTSRWSRETPLVFRPLRLIILIPWTGPTLLALLLNVGR